MTCRYDRTAEDYLDDGEPCTTDEYGDPTNHCTARRSCAVHIGPDELTCPRCIGRVRANLRRIVDLSALTMVAALEATTVDTAAANLAGPAAHPRAWSERRIASRSFLATYAELGRITEAQHLAARLNMADDDDQHPYSVLGRWDMMTREDYDHPSDVPVSIANASAYLERQLPRIAQDPEQDFRLFAREIRDCAQHLEAVLATKVRPERGAPCPECTSEETGVGPRLVRRFGHWCDAEDCTRIHYDDDAGDTWRCPKDHDHEWSHEAYTNWVEERRLHIRREGA